MQSFQKFIDVSFSTTVPPPRRNKDMEIICDSAGRAGAVDSCLQRGMAGIEKVGDKELLKRLRNMYVLRPKKINFFICIIKTP